MKSQGPRWPQSEPTCLPHTFEDKKHQGHNWSHLKRPKPTCPSTQPPSPYLPTQIATCTPGHKGRCITHATPRTHRQICHLCSTQSTQASKSLTLHPEHMSRYIILHPEHMSRRVIHTAPGSCWQVYHSHHTRNTQADTLLPLL